MTRARCARVIRQPALQRASDPAGGRRDQCHVRVLISARSGKEELEHGEHPALYDDRDGKRAAEPGLPCERRPGELGRVREVRRPGGLARRKRLAREANPGREDERLAQPPELGKPLVAGIPGTAASEVTFGARQPSLAERPADPVGDNPQGGLKRVVGALGFADRNREVARQLELVLCPDGGRGEHACCSALVERFVSHPWHRSLSAHRRLAAVTEGVGRRRRNSDSIGPGSSKTSPYV